MRFPTASPTAQGHTAQSVMSIVLQGGSDVWYPLDQDVRFWGGVSCGLRHACNGDR